MAYTPYYTGGWQSGEEGNTPITPDALNHMEEGIENANDLDATPTQGSTKAVQSGGVYTAIQQSTAILPDATIAARAGYRNSIGRGKNLGTFTGMMSDDIKAGDFSGFGIGDTFKYGNRTHTIAHFDPFYHCGDNISLGHHIAVISDGGWTSQWNTSNTTAGGYVGSAIRAYIKSSGGPQEQIIGDFGSGHVLSYRQLYPTTYDGRGKATGWAWTDAMSELINEVLTYGCPVWAINGYEVGIEKFQLALFRLFPEHLNIRAIWWLRSVYSATDAASVYGNGGAGGNGASTSIGVRPLSLIA